MHVPGLSSRAVRSPPTISGLTDFIPRHGQRFRFDKAQNLSVLPPDATHGSYASEVKFKLGSQLVMRVALDNNAGAQATHMFGYTEVELMRPVIDGSGDQLKEGASAFAQRDGRAAGFDAGTKVWIKMDKLKPKCLIIPNATHLQPGAPGHAVLVTLRRAKLAGIRSLTEGDLKRKLQPLVKGDMYSDTHGASNYFSGFTHTLEELCNATPPMVEREGTRDANGGYRYFLSVTGRNIAHVSAAYQDAVDAAQRQSPRQPPTFSWRAREWDAANDRWADETPPPWHASHRVVVLVDSREPDEHTRMMLQDIGVASGVHYRKETLDVGDVRTPRPPNAGGATQS